MARSIKYERWQWGFTFFIYGTQLITTAKEMVLSHWNISLLDNTAMRLSLADKRTQKKICASLRAVRQFLWGDGTHNTLQLPNYQIAFTPTEKQLHKLFYNSSLQKSDKANRMQRTFHLPINGTKRKRTTCFLITGYFRGKEQKETISSFKKNTASKRKGANIPFAEQKSIRDVPAGAS